MIDISPEIKLLSTLQRGSVYYFSEETFSTEGAHYFVVLNREPDAEIMLVLACASSQVGKRQSIGARLGFPPETLVVVRPNEYNSFTVDTIFDCNNVIEKRVQSLIDKLSAGELNVYHEPLSQEIVDRLVAGVLISPQVTEGSKKLVQ